MIINLAYGLPASGKTTYLKSLNGMYIDLDDKSKDEIRECIINLKRGVYNLDFFIKNPLQVYNYIRKIHCKVNIHIKLIDTQINVCLERDSKRPLYRQSKARIKNMKIIDILLESIQKNEIRRFR